MTEAVKKNGLNFGLIVGVTSIVITSIMYAVDVKMFANYWIGICMFVVNLVLGIVAVAKAKKAMGGYISFKDAFTTYFMAMAIGAALGSIFMFVLFNLIDPGAKEIIMERVVEMTVSMMEGFGAKAEDIRKTVEDMKAIDNFGLVQQLKSYIWGLLFYIIIGLIVAASMKRNKPEFEK